MPNEEKQDNNQKTNARKNRKRNPSAYKASKQRWDSEDKWHGSKVAIWLSPQRAQALWHYAKSNSLPALPTEALYLLIDTIGEQDTSNSATGAPQGADPKTVTVLDERLDRFEASTNEALTAISTLLLEILGELRSEHSSLRAEPAPEPRRNHESGVPIRLWLDSLSTSAPQVKETLVVAALILPKSVTLSEGGTVCKISALQINGKRQSTPSEYVFLPSLAVHSAVKKEPKGSTLLIARLKNSAWSIELASVSADGKEKSTLSTFEI